MFSKYVRQRDVRCQWCGSMEHLQCAHIVSRRYLATRWDGRNAMALCRGCHFYFTNHPLEWEVFCGEVYQEMKHEALHGAVPTLDEMLTELEHLKEEIE